MGIRRPCLLLVTLLVPAVAHAHDHFADVYGAPSHQNSSKLVGFHVTFSKTIPEPAGATTAVRRLSFLGDFSPHWSVDSSDKWRINLAAGVRYTFAKNPDQKHLTFVHVLMGLSHVNTAGVGDTDPVVGFGGGYEYVFRDSPAGMGVRGQLDYIVRGGEVSPRVSLGIVLRK